VAEKVKRGQIYFFLTVIDALMEEGEKIDLSPFHFGD